MILAVLSVISLMCLFPNPLWFSVRLVILSVVVLSRLSAFTFLSSLVSFIFILVYLGAMLIVISYICAIVPNPLFLNPYASYTWLALFSGLVLAMLRLSTTSVLVSQVTCLNLGFNPLSVLFRGECVVLFLLVVLMLFFVLLMVTTQYFAPKGPFRSVEF